MRVSLRATPESHTTSHCFVTPRRNSRSRATARRAKPAPPTLTDRRVDATALERAEFDAGLDLDPGPAHNAEFESLVHRILEIIGQPRPMSRRMAPV